VTVYSRQPIEVALIIYNLHSVFYTNYLIKSRFYRENLCTQRILQEQVISVLLAVIKILYSKDFSQKSLDFFETMLYISQGVKQRGGGGND